MTKLKQIIGIDYNTIITELGDHSVPANWAQFVVKREPGETPGPPIIWSEPQNPDEVEAGYGYIEESADESEELFYYHSDHLGSTSYITDQDGNITQYTAYLPYGELLVDEHSSSEDLPYKFNGKELDEETGLYYYGARYMNPTSSVWYGVDPLTEKMPAYSAYVYCLANPVRLIDPTGMIWEDPKDAEKLKTRIDKRIERINKDNTKLQAKIDRGGLSDKKLARLEGRISEGRDRIANLHKSKADIDLLGADQEHVYVLSQISGGIHSVRSGDGNKVYIETSSDALSIHEITHVRQSLDAGGLQFKDGMLVNVGSNYPKGKERYEAISNMEIEAYQMQYSYDKSFPGNVKTLNEIDVHSVGGIMHEGEPVYPLIHTYSTYLKKLEQ